MKKKLIPTQTKVDYFESVLALAKLHRSPYLKDLEKLLICKCCDCVCPYMLDLPDTGYDS